MAEANPYINRSAPVGAAVPSFRVPQNHTLATDPMNQLSQTLSMGMPVAAFDGSGGNTGYYSNQTYQQSPLMQRYLRPNNQTTPWLTNAMSLGMPGWNSNGDGSFTAGQYNPFLALNGRPGQQAQPAPGQPAPGQTPPAQNTPQSGFTPEYSANAQSVGLSPETAYAYQNDPAVKAYLDALNAQKAAMNNTPQGGFTPEYIANAQSVGLSPESAYAYQNDPAVRAYFDALNALKAGTQGTQQTATRQVTAPSYTPYAYSPTMTNSTLNQRESQSGVFDATQPTQADYDRLNALSQKTLGVRSTYLNDDVAADVLAQGGGQGEGYINPNVLAYAKKYPNSVQAQKMAALLGPNWNA